MKEFIPGNEPNPNTDAGNDLVKEANQILSNGKMEAHKEKKAEKRRKKQEAVIDRTIEKRLRSIQIDPDTLEVKIGFHEVITLAPEGDEEGESHAITNKYTVKSPRKPHKDFVNKMRSLRKYAMELAEINDPDVKNYTVSAVKIDGDMLMKQSRASMVLSKKVERTGKVIDIKVSQVAMYSDSDYHSHEKMSRAIEELEAEAWAYIGGKYMDETPNQLPLFR